MLSRAWTTERRRLLHERRQRQWLRSKAKHGYVDFSDAERAELRRYFDALAEDNQRIRLESLEDLFISLGAADTRDEVLKLVAELDEDNNGELDFEEYLEIVRNWTNANITQARLRAAKAPGEYEEVAAAAKRAKETTERLKVFMAMMQGKLGDQTSISKRSSPTTAGRSCLMPPALEAALLTSRQEGPEYCTTLRRCNETDTKQLRFLTTAIMTMMMVSALLSVSMKQLALLLLGVWAWCGEGCAMNTILCLLGQLLPMANIDDARWKGPCLPVKWWRAFARSTQERSALLARVKL